MEKTILVLGSAGKKHDNAITVDVEATHSPDVVHNLNETPWPFKDNQFEYIDAHHVLEHLDNITPALHELHRICKKDGEICIEVPHFSSWCANNPHHKLRFSYFSLDGYIQEVERDEWIVSERRFTFISRKMSFHRSFRRVFLHHIFNAHPLSYERFWTYIFPAENMIYRLKPVK